MRTFRVHYSMLTPCGKRVRAKEDIGAYTPDQARATFAEFARHGAMPSPVVHKIKILK